MSTSDFSLKKILLFFLLMTFVLCSCHKEEERVSVSLADFSALKTSEYDAPAEKIFANIRELMQSDKTRSTADIHVRRHYSDGMDMLWITRCGVSANADTLLSYIQRVDSFGFSREKFYYTQLKDDLQRARALDFDSVKTSPNSAVKVYARLEYYLTKAFLRYTEGQRFGYMNPFKAFNRLDQRQEDTVHVSFRSLYGWHTKLPNAEYLATAFSVIKQDVGEFADFLAKSQPQNPLYYKFLAEYNRSTDKAYRRRLLCNMERCRWENNGDYPLKHKKYVVVNIPSLHLFAHDGDQLLVMKVGVGSLDTKTPLLSSHVKRMDFNPQWIIPKSIVKTSVVHHAGSRAYFDSHNYFVRERSTGKIVDPENVTRDMLLSANYSVVQWGGRGNALGRVIFRFDNDYSIYLHDTSSRGVFARTSRTVSHGCIRVEKPYELAVFMLNDKDEQLMEKMQYSMTADYAERPNTDATSDDKPDRTKMVRSLKVEPQVPIYITYYTLYPDSNGNLVSYDDLYGYDPVIYENIEKYFR